MADHNLYTVGGTVQAGPGLYIPRQADQELLALCRAGNFAYVLAPRQIGKSSLMVRTAERLRHEQVQSVMIDLTQLGVQLSAEEWYLGLLTLIGDQLTLDTDVLDWWRAHRQLGVTQRLFRFFHEVLLNEITSPIVIFVDEIDTTLSLTFTDDFYAVIRSLYDARSRIPALRRLSFVLIGVATPGDLIRDAKRTPFNIGQRVDVTDWTLAEALPLAEGFGLPPEQAEQTLHWVLKWTAGHPYLTQRLCRIISADAAARASESAVDQAVIAVFFGPRSEQDNNLQFVRDMLTKRAPALDATLRTYRMILGNRRRVFDEEQSLVKSHLKLSGVVRREAGVLLVRNSIYATVFNDQWVREHLPVNWLRRLQRAAVVVALLLFAVSLPLAFYAWTQRSAAIVARETAVAGQQTAENAQGEAEFARATAEARLVEADDARQKADIARRTAVIGQQNAGAAQTLAEAQALAIRSLAVADPELGLLLAMEAAQRVEDGQLSDARDEIERVLRQTIQQTHLRRVFGHQDVPFDRVLFSNDGQRVVAIDANQTAYSWNVESGQAIASWSMVQPVSLVLFMPDDSGLLTVSADAVRLWNVATGTLVSQFATDAETLLAAALHPDGTQLVTSSNNGTARVWSVQTGQSLATLKGHADGVYAAAFSPDGARIATGSGDTTARLWQAATGRSIAVLRGHTGVVRQVVYSPDASRLLTTSDDATLRLWRADTGGESLVLKGHSGPISDAAFSPDGAYIVSIPNSTTDTSVRLWDATTGQLFAALQAHTDQVTSATFSPDGQLLLTTSSDTMAIVWEVRTGERVATLRGHSDAIVGGRFSPTGSSVLTASRDATVRLWEVDAGLPTVVLEESDPAVLTTAYSPDGRWIATTQRDNRVRLWDAGSGAAGRVLAVPTGTVTAAIFSPDSRLCALTTDDGTLQLWDIATNRQLRILATYKETITTVSFSADGRFLVAASGAVAQVWEVNTGQERAVFRVHSSTVTDTQFSVNGQFVVTASGDGTARVWEADSGRERAVFRGHIGVVTQAHFSADGLHVLTLGSDGIAQIWTIAMPAAPRVLAEASAGGEATTARLSPDGKLVVTGRRNGTVQVWLADQGTLLATMPGHTTTVTSIAFSHDGRFIVTSSEDGTVAVWATTTGARVASLRGHTGSVTAVRFNPTAYNIATTTADGLVRLFVCTLCGDLPYLHALAREQVTRELSREEREQFVPDFLATPGAARPRTPNRLTMTATPIPTETPRPTSTRRPSPTSLPTPTAIPEPTATPVPPTALPSPLPTATVDTPTLTATEDNGNDNDDEDQDQDQEREPSQTPQQDKSAIVSTDTPVAPSVTSENVPPTDTAYPLPDNTDPATATRQPPTNTVESNSPTTKPTTGVTPNPTSNTTPLAAKR